MKRPWTATKAAIVVGCLLPTSGGSATPDSNTLQCAPQVFVPFTFSGVTRTILSRGSQSTGFSHMAAAWMAMEHFNRRDTSVVPELGDEIFQDCNATFVLGNTENVSGAAFFDTGSSGHQASQLFYQQSQGLGALPCAFVGPYHDETALSIATLAASIGVAHIPSGGHDARLSEQMLFPFTSVLYPRIMDITSSLARFLTLHKRTNYVATLFAYTEMGNQLQEGLQIAMDSVNITQRKMYGYLSPTTPVPVQGQTIADGLRRIKESGYRTIVVTMDNDVYDLPTIANVAEELRLNTAEYLWIFLPPYQHESVQGLIDMPASLKRMINPPMPLYDNVKKLLTGAALLHPVDGFQVNPENDRLANAWRSVDESFVERLSSQANVITPLGVYAAGDYELTNVDYFRTYAPEPGSSYIFDGVMAVGMGMCLAERDSQSSLSATELVSGIRTTNFSGASDRVEFGVSMGLLGNVTSARLSRHMSVGVFNLFPPTSNRANGDGESYVLTAVYTDLIDRAEIKALHDGSATIDDLVRVDEYQPFYFRDGTNTAPALLRDPANQNYLSPGLRYAGLSMMGLSLACCLGFAIWVFVNRKRRIVKASQPEFLYLLIFGAALMSLSIFGISTDEGWGFTAEQLGRHCMSIVWLACLGHIVTYGALFTKLWRVNKVLQFSRRQISVSMVAWPAALLVLAALTILTVWQVLDPLRWVRVSLDETTGESIGQCDAESMHIYTRLLAAVMLIPSVLVCVMAYKTRDVEDTYSEHSWIFTLVLIQLQVILVGIPLLIVLRDVSTDGKYIGLLLLLWFMPMSTILLILLPKVIAHHQGMEGMTRSERNRGSSVGVRVTGVPESASLVDSVRRGSNGTRDSKRTSANTAIRSRISSEANKMANKPPSTSDADEFADASSASQM